MMSSSQRLRNYAAGRLHALPKRPWDSFEDALVLLHGESDRELAKRLRRSVQAIQIRRCRLRRRNKE